MGIAMELRRPHVLLQRVKQATILLLTEMDVLLLRRATKSSMVLLLLQSRMTIVELVSLPLLVPPVPVLLLHAIWLYQLTRRPAVLLLHVLVHSRMTNLPIILRRYVLIKLPMVLRAY